MRRSLYQLLLCASVAIISQPGSAADTPHNIVIFVADGLRGKIVDDATAPHLAALRDEGVYFPNSHSVFPTFTTANASTIATGHQLGDTGEFSNDI